jgi:hypothetical protein
MRFTSTKHAVVLSLLFILALALGIFTFGTDAYAKKKAPARYSASEAAAICKRIVPNWSKPDAANRPGKASYKACVQRYTGKIK